MSSLIQKHTGAYLQEGDIVDVVAPGFKSTKEELVGAIRFLESWGLVPRYDKKIFSKHFLFSSPTPERTRQLRNAILSEDSKVIWCMRGGYGSIRLLPFLDKIKKPKQKKLLIGISDVTSLHIYSYQNWNWPCLHTSLLDRLGKGIVPKTVENEIKKILFGKAEETHFKLKPMNSSAKKNKLIKAPVVGGNLVVSQSTLGTPYEIETKGKIIFFEELGERGYRVDRCLEHFRQAGKFKNCKALIFGHFLAGEEPGNKRPVWPDVLKSWAEELEIPVYSGLESGHGLKQRPLLLGQIGYLK